ncbi:MAG TPA: hypothetical protein VFE24_05200 [Pirellulales bacterium]|jgi:hypothetical protein|nr:hypothetical protein [Pirellulales bacterium]
MPRLTLLALLSALIALAAILDRAAMTVHAAAPSDRLKIEWRDDYLTVRGAFPGGEIRIHYLEAYCRPGSTDRDWKETVIGHKSELVSAADDGSEIRLLDRLSDGVTVDHRIVAKADEVDFQLSAKNPTEHASQATWAQPCIRVDKFTGCSTADQAAIQPKYIRQCFLFIDGKLTRLPTEPWADKARYLYGQVYCPAQVDRHDVNPRPLSTLVPSCGLCGCFSGDEKTIMAIAWEPYQEVFQGVAVCLHDDFRIGGLKPGETKSIRGKLYVVPADVKKLVARFEQDFPEQTSKK